MAARGSREFVAYGCKSASARFVAVAVFAVTRLFAQSIEIRQVAAGGGFFVVLVAFPAASIHGVELCAFLAGGLDAIGAECRRHGADDDC